MSRDERLAQLADEVDDYLDAYGPASAIDVACELSADPLDVMECLERLQEQGRVRYDGGPVPPWVEMGRAFARVITTNH